MGNIIILVILLTAIVLGISVGFRRKSEKSGSGLIMCVAGLFPLVIGICLLPATMWRTISVICLLVASIMIALGITVIMKSR